MMEDEIKKILDDLLFTTTLPKNVSIKLNEEKIIQLKYYITNLKEENKIPEKLETYKDLNNIYLDDLCYKHIPYIKDSLSINEQVIVDKLNEILDYLKKAKVI